MGHDTLFWDLFFRGAKGWYLDMVPHKTGIMVIVGGVLLPVTVGKQLSLF